MSSGLQLLGDFVNQMASGVSPSSLQFCKPNGPTPLPSSI